MLPSITDQLGFFAEPEPADDRFLVRHNGRWDSVFASNMMNIGFERPVGQLVELDSMLGRRDVFGRIVAPATVDASAGDYFEVRAWLRFEGDPLIKSTLLWNSLSLLSNPRERSEAYAKLDESNELVEGLMFAASTFRERVRAMDPYRDWDAGKWRKREEDKRRRRWEVELQERLLATNIDYLVTSQANGKVYMVSNGQAVELGTP